MNERSLGALTERWLQGGELNHAEAVRLAEVPATEALFSAAAALRDAGHGDIVTVSRKVFIPLTHLCRDVCHYCTFSQPPKRGERAFLAPEQVLDTARKGAGAGCDEALFTLGDKPELRFKVAREELAALGHSSTVSYLREMASLVLEETGLLPHINGGVMSRAEIESLRQVSVSQGIMLETAAVRLSEPGGPHFGSPDKLPETRLAMIREAGRARIPFTSGILIGIGETRLERIEALWALKTINDEHGHIQEIIVQNFRAKPATRMASHPEPSLEEQMWTLAVARLIFGPSMSIQSPPNLRSQELGTLISAGLNDWGGVSPVTPDFVNPEAPWPTLTRLGEQTAQAGKTLVPRLAIYPAMLKDAQRWIDPAVTRHAFKRADGQGLAQESGWRVGLQNRSAPAEISGPAIVGSLLARAIDDGYAGKTLSGDAIVRLFEARGPAAKAVREAADAARHAICGNTVSYVVTRNINYTNVCGHRCQFCAFSKGNSKGRKDDGSYDLELKEIVRRAREAWDRGATEVCMQGGIHPDYSAETYLSICRAIKAAVPGIHIHAFSPLEVSHGAHSSGLTVTEFLLRLVDEGLASLPGTAAEILDDEIRSRLCADKLSTKEWLAVVEDAHGVGLRTTATIMFGHIDGYANWARHLLRIRALQERTGGFTEFVPLPFVHMDAPIYRKGLTRQGPSFREAVLMHAVARLVFNRLIPNIQASWVKLGEDGVAAALSAGVNDLGGTLMNESISRAAGTVHGQEMPPEGMEALIRSCGRPPRQRTTLYGTPEPAQMLRSYRARPLAPVVLSPAAKLARVGSSKLQRYSPQACRP